MKQKLLLLLMALVALQPLRAAARDFTYTYEGQTVTYTVIDEAARTCMVAHIDSVPDNKNISGELILPANPKDGETDFILTEIGNRAFYNLKELTAISFPQTLTTIGEWALSGTGITSLIIPDSVEDIKQYFCYGCRSLTSVTVGNSVTVIPPGAFCYCDALTEVNLPNSIVSIENNSFGQCYSLEEFTIPASVKYLAWPFNYCTSLWKLNIESTLEDTEMENLAGIFNGSFRTNLYQITVNEDNPRFASDGFALYDKEYSKIILFPWKRTGSYSIPSTVELIGQNSFYSTNLSSLEIPNSVIKIGDAAFQFADNLSSIVIPNSVDTIGSQAFYSADNLTAITIPESVKYIGDNAFGRCSSLTDLTIEGEMPTLGTAVFSYCPYLQHVTIEDENYIFQDGILYNSDFTTLVTVLGSIEGEYKVIDSVTKIHPGAFSGQREITDIRLPDGIVEIGDEAFSYCSLTSINIPTSLTVLSKYLFNQSNQLTSIIIPNSVTVIGEGAFESCYRLEEVEIPESVTTIRRAAFCGTGISSIKLPSKITKIEDSAFTWCQNLTSIEIPENVTNIEYDAFLGCSSLTSVALPNSVDSIGLNAFNKCEKLEKVYAPSMESWMGIAFADETANPLYYGAELIINNQSTDVVEIPEETEEVSDYAFAGLKNLVEVVISEAVEKIGNGSFTGTGLENITIPQSVKEIGEKAFQNCKSLISAVIGKITGKLTRAGEVAESELTSVGNEAFAGCESLDRVSIGSNVGSIGELAFAGSGSITRVDVYSLIAPEAADDAFDTEVCAQAELHVPAGYADIFESAPVWSSFSKIVADLDAPETLTLDSENLKLHIGEKKQLTATSSSEGALTWESSDEEVATVSANGLVTAISEGTAKITVTAASGARAFCEVTVEKIEATGIELNLPSAEVVEGESVELTATITPADATDQSVTWTSSDESVATVDAFGNVSALKPGKATITAKTSNGLTATCVVTVVAKVIEVEGIELNLPEATIKEEETVQLIATVTPADADDQTVTWSSSNEAVATVDQDGLVTALKAGTATITARTANGLTAKCELTVETKTGIDGVEADAQVSVAGRDGVITVAAPEGAEVEVYSMTGMRVAKTREHRIEGLAGGVYIVRVAGKSFKVML